MSNSLFVTSNALDAEDVLVLLLALDQLNKYTSNELAKEGTNNIKLAALINMQSRILVVRGKLRVMRGGAMSNLQPVILRASSGIAGQLYQVEVAA